LAPDAPTPAGETHLDQCLGCRRCEAVCPAGVQYGPLLVAARAQQRGRRAPGWRQRAVERLAAMPALLDALLHVYRLAWPLLPARLRRLPRPPGAAASVPVPGERVARVALFSGCIARPYEGSLRDAIARLCAPLGFDAEVPPGQGCCGTLHAHAGDTLAAGRLAMRNREAFAGYGQVLTLASGCHEAVVEALGGQGVVEDAAAFLARQPRRLRFRETRQRVALHVPCTQQSVVHSGGATRELLARVPGLEVMELDAGHGCCGAAGTHMLHDPARASALRAPLLAQLGASGATRLLSANIGCRLHLANGTALPVQHPLEFLAGCLVDDAHAGRTDNVRA
ncbi:MAG TPA: heterodisulfide reductase-related iron-sulfur binding cluster, partial [Xanthomonadaceae bacterium]|nr:heterodisulfide reductase-related iron-sulfur binding cluster [Xanthomonadaceae bacterium]